MSIDLLSKLKKKYLLTIFTVVLVLQGCAGGVSRESVKKYDNLLAAGGYQAAANLASADGELKDGKSNNLLWSLNAGAAYLYAGQPKQAISALDAAEDIIKQIELGKMSASGQYKIKGFDATMTNAYKGLAGLALGNEIISRSEMYRTEDRQKRAEQDFEKEVLKARGELQVPDGVNLNTVLNSARSNTAYQEAVQGISSYGGYKPFVNPFTTYLAGLYFLNTADKRLDLAKQSFERVLSITGNQRLIQGDIALTKLNGKFSPKVWVLFENGQSSTIDQYSISFPVPIVGKRSGVSVATVALPRLVENRAATAGLLVGDERELTTDVGNFDFVMRSEFQRRYPLIITRAVIEAIAKIALQNAAAQEKSGYALLAAALVSNVSTTDTRSWTALPKYFQAARVDAPKDGKIKLRTAEGVDLGIVTVPTEVSSIVYVKMFRSNSPPSVQVIKF